MLEATFNHIIIIHLLVHLWDQAFPRNDEVSLSHQQNIIQYILGQAYSAVGRQINITTCIFQEEGRLQIMTEIIYINKTLHNLIYHPNDGKG